MVFEGFSVEEFFEMMGDDLVGSGVGRVDSKGRVALQ